MFGALGNSRERVSGLGDSTGSQAVRGELAFPRKPRAIKKRRRYVALDRPESFGYARRNMRRPYCLLLSAFLAAFVLLVCKSAEAQMKVAVVDLQRAVMQSEDGLRAQATLKKVFDSRQQ